MRLAPNNTVAGKLLDFNSSTDVRNMQPGLVIEASGTDFDYTANVSNWSDTDLIYVSSVNTAPITPGSLCQIDKNFRITLTAASEANTGKPVFVAITQFQIGSTTEQWGYVMRRGMCPVQFSVAATVGAVYGGTAGKASPTAAAGVQIQGMRCLTAAAATFTRAGVTRVGSSQVKLGNVGGMYVGQAISGTGIPGASVISNINTDGTSIVIGSAIGTPVNATATGNPTLTLTNTGYGICQISYPAFQTQIT